MAGTRQKPPGELVNQRGGRGDRALTVRTDGVLQRPRMPAGLGSGAQREWAAFWADPVLPYAVKPADWGMLFRWITAVDERHRVWKEVIVSPTVMTRTGEVRHPLWAVLRQLDDVIMRIADRFGMNTQSRFRLQIKRAEAAQGEDKLAALLARRAMRPTRDVTPGG